MYDFVFAVGYTLILMIVASFYYFYGRRIGVQTAVEVLHEIEPKAMERVNRVLKERLNG